VVLSAIATAVVVALSFCVAMRPAWAGSPMLLVLIGAPYALLSGLAITRMAKEGSLASKLRPRSGDLSLGALVTIMLFSGALVGRNLLAPEGSVRVGWLMRIYMQVGDPELVQRHIFLASLGVVLVAALEEVAWRGYVFDLLDERLGTRRAWPATAILYAAAHLPTLVLLRDPFAGPNPLVVLAALGCGLVWGLLVARTGRLPVAIFSHALFAWGVSLAWRFA
jgi:membrane protease YdiL (CAAX protease family)